MATTESHGPDRLPLNRDRILDAGIGLADETGVDGLSMRKLAGRLGYEVISLYNHVRNKDDLLEGMLDRVFGELGPPPESADWKSSVRTRAVATHEMLLRHPWAAPQVPFLFPGRHRFGEAELLLEQLTAGGFTGHLRDVGYHAITLHIGGFTQQQLSYDMGDERLVDGIERFHREVSAADFPHMVDHVRYHEHIDEIPGERPDEFRFVLDLILDGLERLRDGIPPRWPGR
jgi:AcrR family transcriptional regulator